MLNCPANCNSPHEQNRRRGNLCGGFHFSLLHTLQCQGVLGGVEVGIDAALCQQLGVTAALGDDTVGDGDDAVGVADGTQAVGDDQGGAAHGQIVEGPLDLGLRHGVQGGGGFVQDQDGGILQEDSGDGYTLLLSAGQQSTALTDIGVKLVGHRHDIVIDLRPLGSLHHLFHGSAGAAVADILENGVGKQKHILLHDANVLVDGVLGHIPDILAVDGDGAAGDLVEPGNQLAQGGLAAAGGTDDGDGLAGLHIQADAVEHIQVAIVGEDHVADLDIALHIGQGLGIGLVLDGGLGAHDIDKPGQTCHAVGEHLGEGGQLPDGAGESGNIQGEGDQVHIVHLALHDQETAVADDDDIQAGEEEFHGAEEPAHGLVEFPLGGLEDLIGGVEAGLLHLFVGVGLGGADAGEGGFDLGVDVGGLGLGSLGSPGHGLAHEHDDEDGNGDHHRHHQGQPPLDGGHHYQRADDGQHGGDQVLRAMVGQLRQLEEVGSQPAHELASAVLVIEIEAHLLHVAEQVPADVRLHPNAEGMAPVGHHELQQGSQDITAHRHSHHREEGLVQLVGQHIVQGVSGDQGEGQVNGRDQHGAGHVQGEELLMGAEIAQKDHNGMLFLKFFSRH